MMSKMDTLNETELRGLASCHLMRELLDECESIRGRSRVRWMSYAVDGVMRACWRSPSLEERIAHHRGYCPAIVAHWLKASDR